jgi:hypothetical protein
MANVERGRSTTEQAFATQLVRVSPRRLRAFRLKRRHFVRRRRVLAPSATLQAMRLSERLRRGADAPSKELDEVRRLAESENLTDGD